MGREETSAFGEGADDFWGSGRSNPYPQDTQEWSDYEAGYASQEDQLTYNTKEGGYSAMKNKNLNDLLSNDRSVSRAARGSYGSGLNYPGYRHRCYNDHPPMPIPGTDMVIYGGSCSSPVVTDADVYIGFDGSMRWTERHYPWKKGDEIYFRIQDMGVPTKPEEFKKLVAWTGKQLEAGRKVHCGCIGGHGRTGTFLAALVSEYGEQDAIKYVRDNYCQKAVESKSQIIFLNEHFGIKEVAGSKEKASSKSSSSKQKVFDYEDFAKAGENRSSTRKAKTKTYGYLKGGGSIWE